MKQKLLLLVITVLSCFTLYAQNRTITGKVVDAADGLPIPGASIRAKGTSQVVQTTNQGTFSISVPSTVQSLVFSFIGYTEQEVSISDNMTVRLSSSSQSLSEVVVTAFGIERKTKSVGYTSSILKSSDLAQKSEPDPIRAMTGKVAGVNIIASNGVPGSATNITIRGNSSFLGNTKPLIIVDGIPFDNSSNQSGASTLVNNNAVSNRAVDLDPNNIESMEVLKSAAAAALYGSRAANGVIVITTKSGKTGTNKDLGISYSGSYAMEKVSGLPDYQNTYGAGSEFNYSNANGSWGPAFNSSSLFPQGDGVTNGTIPHWYAGNAAFPQFPTGTRTPYQAYSNNVKDFFQTGHVSEHQVAVSNGGDKGSYSISASNSNNGGVIDFSDFERTTINLGGNLKLNSKVSVFGTLSYVNSKQNGLILGAQNGVGQASAFARTLYFARNWNLSDFNVMPYQNPVTLGQVFPVSGVDNPYWSIRNNSYKSNVNRTYGSVGFNYDALDWLSFNYRVGLNQYTDSRIRTIRRGSVGAAGIGEVTDDDIYNQEIESTFLATVNRNITSDIKFKGIVGHNINQRTSDRQSVVGTNMVVFDIDDIDNTANVIPNGGGYARRRLMGAFADIQFDYKNFLFLNITGRNDWSSTLPKANNSFFYPSANASFVFSELIRDKTPWLSYGKIRANWAKVGNDASPYSLIPTFSVNPSLGNNASNLTFPFLGVSAGTVGNTLADPNLTPEFSTEREIGTELRFLNDRFGIDFTYYSKKSTNQIALVTVPGSTGFTGKITNFGEMTNKGIEIGLDINPFKNPKGFNWNIYGVFSRNRNMVVSLTEGLNEISVVPGFGDPAVVLRPGQPYGIMLGTRAAKDADGNFLINRTTGLMIREAAQVIGDPNPKFITGLTNTFSYKGFSFSFLVDYRHGGDLYSATVGQLLGRGVTTDTEDRLTPKIIKGYYGDPTTYQPILDANGNKIPNQVQTTTNDFYFNTAGVGGISEMLVFDASVLRLREVSLSYNLPKTWLAKTKIAAANISLTARNLFYYAPNFPKGTNFDPETSTYGSGDTRNISGIEYTNAPNTKRFGVNLRLTF
ncbi:MAG: SusC/RagA family TonB-linked outer membrane protein [Pedobacter sp.]|uniref:SusC/RagA family TonB-linked outer membrane protein n=1 Tax=Pedobacter sp. TaxID=1411316 RepID=UPI00280802F3|nr:SusC/RagA family TonB-linked outer membrane protein [Pedobacter sp.]MDQ8006556.1 SusC/RagA family TonB-linked outer membrane protein [Pedobacter sp.]